MVRLLTFSYLDFNIFMLCFISPAKTFSTKLRDTQPGCSPVFLQESLPIIEHALQMDDAALTKDFKLSPKKVAEARQHWLRFLDDNAAEAPALLAYSGMVFKKIDAKTFDESDWAFAEQHLRICSFVYGMLTPSTLIRPYRMEGTVRLGSGLRVFDYWKPYLTDYLIAEVKKQGGVLVNLASDEMQQLFDWERVKAEVRLINCHFDVRTADGSTKNVTIYCKMARGAMARLMIKGKLKSPDELKALAPEGFTYDERASQPDDWHFTLES